MAGWNKKILYIDLSKGKWHVDKYSGELAREFVGGRGFAIKLLWDLLEPGTDPLSPRNILVIAAGPLTGLPAPSSGKVVIAAKSPLTGGYGDGNIGTLFSVNMRRAGYDAIVITGTLERPGYIYIEDGKVEIRDAEDLWGRTTFETEKKLREVHGKDVGILEIGPAGERLVKFANVISQEGRAGGRPGMGAVMGSKKLKAIVVKGTGEIPVADAEELKKVAAEAYDTIRKSPNYGFWMRQGTMATVLWSQENCCLPTYNFREGVFEKAYEISGDYMEKIKVGQRGCPNCNMICGNVVRDVNGVEAELDYENVAMLGSNIGIGRLEEVAALNRFADEHGVDTISLGNVIGFAMEASEKGIISERIEWGDFKAALQLAKDIVERRGLGDTLAEGVKRASEKIGGDSHKFAMHVKGLEISAYDCHAAPAMALAYATSPIGAHHKDAWVISWEVKVGRLEYTREKAEKVIELQRLRGGLFEVLTVCRLPWVEVGLPLDYYPKLFKAATGIAYTLQDFYTVADRIYALIRAFWIREYGHWKREYDYPPPRWFDEPLTKGKFAGAKLDRDGYEKMLNWYYEARGWDSEGVPKRETLEKLGLGYVVPTLEKVLGRKLQ